MAFGYRSRSNRGGFRRGGRGSFRGRGRGSDSYFGSSNRGSYSDKSSYRGNSYRGNSNFRERDDYYESRSSGSKYGHDKYSGSHSRKDEDSYQYRNMREHASSGSFSRDHSRRSDGEPERKKLRSEIGSYKEGVSPRRSCDDIEHSSRGFSNYSSPYHSDTSPFGKSQKKEYSEFKKPMAIDHDFGSRRSRGSRGRGNISRAATRNLKSTAPALLKRSGVSRISRLTTAARLQNLLRRKKQLRMMRMRREREERLRLSGSKHQDKESNMISSDEELEGLEDLENEQQMEEEEENVKPDVKTMNEEKSDSKKVTKKVIKKEPRSTPEKTVTVNNSEEPKEKKKYTSVKGLRRDHIALKCVHCQKEYETFRVYHLHLSSYKHKVAMEKLLHSMKQKLSRMRTDQREQQRIIDEQNDDFAKTSYCKLCKLNYKQTKQEHYTSDFHINMSEFLNPRCSVCRVSFATPILYEHHRCTIQHIKRKAFLEKNISLKDEGVDDENNDEESFMVLDSVGSADESNEEVEQSAEAGDAPETSTGSEMKKKAPKLLGSEFIKKVSCYYCKLCRLCLTYNPNRDQEELLLSHCRGRFHLKRFSLEKLKSKKKQTDKGKSEDHVENANTNEVNEGETDEKFWTDENTAEGHKSSEDEEDSHSGNRYDRFGHSDEKETVEKLKTNTEVVDGDAATDDHLNTENAVKKEPE